jgi:hypothetical protein
VRKQSLCLVTLALVLTGCQRTTTVDRDSGQTRESATKKLTMSAATSQTIGRGEKNDLTVMIGRANFDDPVAITLSDLPPGVTAASTAFVVPPGRHTATARLTAAPDAKAGEHTLTLTARAPGVADNIQKIKLTVK